MWQRKDLETCDFGSVANNGVRGGSCGSVANKGLRGIALEEVASGEWREVRESAGKEHKPRGLYIPKRVSHVRCKGHYSIWVLFVKELLVSVLRSRR